MESQQSAQSASTRIQLSSQLINWLLSLQELKDQFPQDYKKLQKASIALDSGIRSSYTSKPPKSTDLAKLVNSGKATPEQEALFWEQLSKTI